MMPESVKRLYIFASALCALAPTTLAAMLVYKLHLSGVWPAAVFMLCFALTLMLLCVNYAGSEAHYHD